MSAAGVGEVGEERQAIWNDGFPSARTAPAGLGDGERPCVAGATRAVRSTRAVIPTARAASAIRGLPAIEVDEVDATIPDIAIEVEPSPDSDLIT
jgi:hypothetical protein